MLASLDDVPVRELEATAEAIESRRHPLHDYTSLFRGVAYAREGAGTQAFRASTSGRLSDTVRRER